jgi:hypothetical protein
MNPIPLDDRVGPIRFRRGKMADESERATAESRQEFVDSRTGCVVYAASAGGESYWLDLAGFQNSPSLLNLVVFGHATGIQGSLSQNPTVAAHYLLKTSEMRGSTLFRIATQAINEAYVIEGRQEVEGFIRQNRLQHWLEQAVGPLNEYFGKDAIKVLKLITDDEGSQTLFCLVMVAGSLGTARRSLASFDRNWWLPHSGKVAGKLNFDYELV